MSGGESQRVSLARALIGRPRLLLLDEPFSKLDEPLKQKARVEIFDHLTDLKITTILVTHDQEEALLFGDKIALLAETKIQQFGSPEELLLKPKNQVVSRFLEGMRIIEGHAEQNRYEFCIQTDADMPLAGERVELLIRWDQHRIIRSKSL